jgi:hypothetical protein
MPHTIEPAPSGRAKCRGCGRPIASGVLRFGERLPNPFADGDAEMTLWYHLECAAYKRPEPLLGTLIGTTGTEGARGPGDEGAEGTKGPEGQGTIGVAAIPNRAQLESDARAGLAHRRLPRVDAVSRAPSGRAMCRACKAAIEKDSWRIALVFYEDGRFAPSGFMHLRCAREYLETTDLMRRLCCFSPGLTDEDQGEIQAELKRV